MSIIKKVPIEELLYVLEDLYERGVDYVDIIPSFEDNKLNLIYSVEYLNEDALEHLTEEGKEFLEQSSKQGEDIKIGGNLSDEDLNQLI